MNNPYVSTARTITVDRQKVVDSKIDVILSSVRPFSQNAEYAKHQRNALDSWFSVARQVILFNLPEDTGNYNRPGLIYVGPEANPPPIKQMLSLLRDRNEDDIVALVNADIILGPEVGKIPIAVLNNSLGRAWACVSGRRTLNTKDGTISTGMTDNGLDFFCSTVRIWNDVAKQIPGVFTFGRAAWDNWLNSFLHTYIDKSKYWDLTPWGCVIHPVHGEHFRLPTKDEESFSSAVKSIVHPGGFPTRKLNLP